MPNIASVLKTEISRIARREARNEIAALKKLAGTHRTEIAALKRRAQAAEQELRRLRGKAPRTSEAPIPADAEAATVPLRFSAKGLASQRKRLGLSAEDTGLLLGTSGQSVYNWESGKARPRAKHLAAIAALKTLGKKRAKSLLESVRAKG